MLFNLFCRASVVAGVVALLGGTGFASGQPAFERVATGLNQPLFVTAAPGRPGELFIVEKGGSIQILNLNDGSLSSSPFLSVPDTDPAREGGLLGLAFHPDFATNGKLYVNVTVDNGGTNIDGAISPFSTHIREYTVAFPTTDTAVASGPREVLRFVQPQANHNGGWIGFNPASSDTNLYIMSGDGGNANDGGDGHTDGSGNAQDITDNLLGKVLRINVEGDDFIRDDTRNYSVPTNNPFVGETGDDEIFAYGLRNPFQASFDRLTGDLYIGDVGQDAREEIDRILASSDGGENFGWRLREGDIQTPGSVGGDVPDDYTPPLYDYVQGTGEFQGGSVTGGLLYRGPVEELAGLYIFGDFISEQIWAFDPDDPDGTIVRLDDILNTDFGEINNIAAFGEDLAGNLYVVDLGGEIFKLVPEPGTLLLAVAGFALLMLRRRPTPNSRS